jgi:hypothetical protein
VISACGIAPISRGMYGDDRVVLGTRPGHGLAAVSAVPNRAAIDRLLWVPGLDQGRNPQVDGSILMSAYRSVHFGVNRGSCRVFRVDPTNGCETGHFDVPPPCGHAGGLAYAGVGELYIADTQVLFEMDLVSAFRDPAPAFRAFSLGPRLKGALAASGRNEIWIGTYEEDRSGKISSSTCCSRSPRRSRRAECRFCLRHPFDTDLRQDAAVAAAGKLWLSRSEIAWGALDGLDIASGRVERSYTISDGIEGISFNDVGRLWAVSEAGARHNRWVSPFFPIIFRFDVSRLKLAPGH